ncbi:HD domain-containing protein [Halomarina litorea]|uniref:HD domain-containing protein n=1 Tax=Halomarina litorea TaxID=2961595 RepID=UPI0020C46735|nr:HD domain-containing protein [Halomarina sp. BCD28]
MLDAVRDRARPFFEGAAPAHDWHHVERVGRLARTLARLDDDETVLLAAVYLHDVGREREARGEVEDHAVWGAERAREILPDVGADEDTTDHVAHCVRAHRYSGSVEPETREARVLCDADNLDAMGAVGIGRAFAHGGTLGHPMHGDEASQLAHAKGKLLSLRDRMYTERGRELAAHRHSVVEEFVAEFEAELAGER